MSTFSKERNGNTPPSGGRDPKPQKMKGDTGMKVKPGFMTGVPGKTQPRSRNNGVPEGGAFGLPMNHPKKEGI